MTHYLGVDIGTFETKGVLVDGAGNIVASAARAHRMLVPQPGWAEHRAEEDWWGDFVHVTRKLLATSAGLDPGSRMQRHRPLHAAGGRSRDTLVQCGALRR